ncbi:IclR family transcriptional regulator [Microbacterium soli]|uniref:IclR family transcriptional regulator n=1 Tax=Microbacterium soli TaxID=446075 RepID=UPI0031E22E82
MAQVSKTVDNALWILQLLGEQGAATSIELAKLTGLSRTIVYRSLSTLEARGFVRRDGSSYSLGLTILNLSDSIESDIRTAAQSGLEQLAARYDATCVLVVADGTDGVILDQRVSQSGPTQIRYSLGFRSPLAAGGHGRAILAFSPPKVVEAMLGKLSDVGTAERLRETLSEIRRRGYAYSSDEIRFGVSGLAVPILDRKRRAVGSIGLVTVAGGLPDLDDVSRTLMSTSASISEQLLR